MAAAASGQAGMVGLLLDRKANINVQNAHGWTALHWAVQSGPEWAFDANGPQIDPKHRGKYEGADCYFTNPAEYNGDPPRKWSLNRPGNPPRSWVNVTRILVEHGANVSMKTAHIDPGSVKYSALQCAKGTCNAEIEALLTGAKPSAKPDVPNTYIAAQRQRFIAAKQGLQQALSLKMSDLAAHLSPEAAAFLGRKILGRSLDGISGIIVGDSLALNFVLCDPITNITLDAKIVTGPAADLARVPFDLYVVTIAASAKETRLELHGPMHAGRCLGPTSNPIVRRLSDQLVSRDSTITW